MQPQPQRSSFYLLPVFKMPVEIWKLDCYNIVMQATLIKNNTHLELSFPYNPRVVGVIKHMQGRAFNPRNSRWMLPIDGLAPQNFKRLEALGFDLTDSRLALSAPAVGHLNASSYDGKYHLRPYQSLKALEAINLRGGLIRGFCGCGKTAISIKVVEALSCNNVLVVCPKSVLFNWQKEVKMWLGHEAVVINGSKSLRHKAYDSYTEGFIITTYDQLKLDYSWYASRNWDGMIIDEAHYLVSTTSQRSKAVVGIKAKYKYGLTATPIMNKATDVFGVFSSLGKSLGNYKLFVDRYCVKDIWGSVKYYQNLPELRARISSWQVRINLDEAQFELPERTDTDLEFELSEPETVLYDKIRKELLFELQAQDVNKLSSPMILQNTLTKLGKLQELTDSCELLGDNNKSSKLEILKEHLFDVVSSNQKAVIFTRFSRMAEILNRELEEYNPCLLTGQISDRQILIDEFTNNPARKIFISTEAGNAGINLQAANIIYNYDLPFSLGKLEQRNGRIRWHTQDKPVFFYNLMARLKGGRKTIDQWVKEKIIKKQEISDQVLMSDVKEILE